MNHDDNRTISELANDIVNIEEIIEDSIEQAQGGRVPPGFHEFWPWRFQTMSRYPDRESFVDEICELSPPNEWNRIRNYQSLANGATGSFHVDPQNDTCEYTAGHYVDVRTDVFRPWEGPISCPDTGENLSVNASGHVWPAGWPSMSDGDDWGIREYKFEDMSKSFWNLIDSCPNLTFLLGAEHSERIRENWVQRAGRGAANFPDRVNLHPDYRSNVYLLARCNSQAQLEERVPHLLQCRDLSPVLGLEIEVREEMNLKRVRLGNGQRLNALTGGIWSGWQALGRPTLGVDWVRLRPSTTGPTNPDHVMSLVEQCKAAGVPVWDDTGISGLRELPDTEPLA